MTPLSADEVADLKLAVTEAANDYVDDTRPDEQEGRLHFAFKLLEDRLVLELEGPVADVSAVEQELGRAIIDATADECDFAEHRTRLVNTWARTEHMLQPVAVGHKSLADYTHLAGKELVAEIRELAEELGGPEGPAPLGDGVRRRRLRDPLRARAVICSTSASRPSGR